MLMGVRHVLNVVERFGSYKRMDITIIDLIDTTLVQIGVIYDVK